MVAGQSIEKELHFGDGKGGGGEMDVLSGPVFTLVFTVSAIFGGSLGDGRDRMKTLARERRVEDALT